MILDKLILHNFGLYRGKQTFEFTPLSHEKPVVLIGGQNGGGKTTILDAVQLALYGPRAHTSRRDNTGYDSYLRACINRGVTAKDGASVAIQFRYVSEGEQRDYEVRRQWSETKTRIKETVSVYRNGDYQADLSEHWSDIVEEMIPIGISRLFFFDAEQIRFLADDETSHQALGTAVKSLLGLDLAERLVADAMVLETRLTEKLSNADVDPYLRQMQKQLAEKDDEVRSKKQELAPLETTRLRAIETRKKVEEQFAAVGGKHWLEREVRQKELESTKLMEKICRTDLVKLAAGELPFALVSTLVKKVGQRDEAEQHNREATVIQDVLVSRDALVIDAMKANGIDELTLKLLYEIQKADRDSRSKQSDTPPLHGLSESSRTTVRHLQNGALSQRLETASELLKRFETTRKKREQLERSLRMTPDDESIADIFSALKQAIEYESKITSQTRRIEEEVSSLQLQRDDLDKKVASIRRKFVDSEIDCEQTARMIQLSIRTQSTMREFQRKATAQKIDRLSKLVTESFQFLLRKQALVDRVEIDPESFGITLYSSNGEKLSKEQLSEGEKQIFAVSVLWGLAQASPRPLPAIIDTPMARLDMEHRKHIVEHYFPHASHQVIVLSTDAEIDETFYPKLQPFVSHEYHLNYNEGTQATIAEDGYFPAFKRRIVRKSS